MRLHPSQLTGALLTFREQKEEQPGVISFRFDPNGYAKWQAGQYYVYFLPGALLDPRLPLRPFSVSAAPSEGHLQITTRVSDNPSKLKQQLLKLKPGSKVIAAGPYGFFTLEKPAGKYVFIAGGIGITPFRAMLQEFASRAAMPEVTLLYANRDPNVLFQTELDALAKMYPKLTIHYLLEPERIDADSIKKYVPELAVPTYYLSGPKPMVQATAELLTKLGVPAGQVKRDSFTGYPW